MHLEQSWGKRQTPRICPKRRTRWTGVVILKLSWVVGKLTEVKACVGIPAYVPGVQKRNILQDRGNIAVIDPGHGYPFNWSFPLSQRN